jgi:hypothetical protein
MLEHHHIVQRRHIGLLLMVGFHKVIVVVIVLVKELVIKSFVNYIGLLMEVFIHRSNMEEVVLELRRCYHKILQLDYLFVFQIIYCQL